MVCRIRLVGWCSAEALPVASSMASNEGSLSPQSPTQAVLTYSWFQVNMMAWSADNSKESRVHDCWGVRTVLGTRVS